MATYVLVHGAWHGGWCWQRVIPLLRADGHAVYAPTLTGLGERSHLLTPAIDLTTHARDVLGVLEYEDLDDVVLVGHSYGGVVITAVADQAAARLQRLVYLDAFVPADGQAVFDLLPPERRAVFEEQARSAGEGWRIPPPPLEGFGVTEDADLEWARPRVGPHPLKTFQQPVRLTSAAALALPRTYIWCSQFGTFRAVAERARDDTTWRYHELATGHDAMITAPGELAGLLRETAPVA